MTSLIKILKEVVEAKQAGTLYHFTSTDNAVEIADGNFLKTSSGKTKRNRARGGNKVQRIKTISLTRNKNFNNSGMASTIGGMEICFVIDGNKLSNHYKINPFHDFEFSNPDHYEDDSDRQFRDEDEEIVWGSKIDRHNGIRNLNSYVKEVVILPSKSNHVAFVRGELDPLNEELQDILADLDGPYAAINAFRRFMESRGFKVEDKGIRKMTKDYVDRQEKIKQRIQNREIK
jgi:hypothetical protein